MIRVFASSWPLFLGLLLLMIGNGVQGTLLGIRGGIEGFSTFQMSVVMSGYFVGFLFGSQIAPELIRRVGHVRVFAALGSLISAVMILYAALPDWMIWTGLRILIGFSFSGVYVTAESWLNNTSTNETRGQTLSLYMIVQVVGIISAQGLINLADPAGYLLFVIPSVLVSLAFTPILLSASPAPVFGTAKRLSFKALYDISPLGCVGMFLMGGVFAAMFGMAAVWGAQAGLSVRDISIFVAAIYIGGLLFQYPIGWLSDRMDRRRLIMFVAAFGTLGTLVAVVFNPGFVVLLGVAVVIGGVANPLYSLLLAYTNDYLQADDMAAASGGLMFINGVGAIVGPLAIGWLMSLIGPKGFFLYIAMLTGGLTLYAIWRMRRRAVVVVGEASAYTAMTQAASIVAMEPVFEAAHEQEEAGDTPGAAAAR
ncbi:MFS transporter [Roseicitreum antarcticum]|uniref:Predicted arabinose efflux permease, MFS family n=1 Tax=Roseicitreum antarcticum TaxID=564137 RepID=A0A1H2ZXW8_9RHOB|nr:MFS transporter [Roseicitreum antarcticum]SDX22091.1 Predicted arabinose efflux permease, MFS family [Roseicitreum antarcticum]